MLFEIVDCGSVDGQRIGKITTVGVSLGSSVIRDVAVKGSMRQPAFGLLSCVVGF
jgi:hypothetical protein